MWRCAPRPSSPSFPASRSTHPPRASCPRRIPLRAAYEDFRDRYGRDQAILIAIEGDDVFDLAFLEKLRALHEELEAELPHLQDVQSLRQHS